MLEFVLSLFQRHLRHVEAMTCECAEEDGNEDERRYGRQGARHDQDHERRDHRKADHRERQANTAQNEERASGVGAAGVSSGRIVGPLNNSTAA